MAHKKSAVRYPTGTVPPKMMNYDVRPVRRLYIGRRPYRRHRHKGYSKYFAKKLWIDGHRFDSKSEGSFYLLLKRRHINFSIHTKYTYRPHYVYKSIIDGKTYALVKRSYRPDFVEYKPGAKHVMANIIKVVDVKGKNQITPAASQRIDDFTAKFHLPVVIARLDKKRYVFVEYIKGYRRHSWTVPLL